MSNSISCESINPKLDAFHDNELTPQERVEVETHIRTCTACARYLADVDTVGRSLSCLPVLTPKVDVAANFEQILAARSSKPNVVRMPIIWGSVGVAAAAAIAIFFGRGLVNPNATVVGSALTPHSVNSTIASVPKEAKNSLADKKLTSPLPARSAEQKSEQTESTELANNEKNSKLEDRTNGKLEVQEVAHNIGSEKSNSGKSNIDAGRNTEEQKLVADNAASQAPTINTQTGSGRGSMDGSGSDEIASNQQSPENLGTGAIRQINSGTSQNGSAGGRGGRNLIAVYDAEQQNNEELGIATDEDGLYAIKL